MYIVYTLTRFKENITEDIPGMPRRPLELDI